MKVEGKTAVVTGGASGIGAAIARELVRRGCRVAIADYDYDGANALANELGGNASAHQFDAADPGAIEAMAEAVWSQTGGVDLVFANAGICKGAPLLEAKPEEFDWHFGVNIRGFWVTGKAFISPMIAQRTKSS